MTELIFRQPTVAQATIPAELAADAPTVVTAVLCAYCRAAIPADSFGYWSPAKRLLSASCPDCHRGDGGGADVAPLECSRVQRARDLGPRQ